LLWLLITTIYRDQIIALHILALIALSGMALVPSVSAQSILASNTDSGTVLGRVLDVNEDPVTCLLLLPPGFRMHPIVMFLAIAFESR
jgi:hypothetical protein